MTKKPVFGFCGAAGAGKDSVANYMSRVYNVARYGFSWPLKELCCSLFGWDMGRINDLDYKEQVAPVRTICRDEAAAICKDQFAFLRPVSAQQAVIDHVWEGLNKAAWTASAFGEELWTRRKVLQHVGTEVFRAIDPEHWTTKAIEKIRVLQDREDVPAVAVVDVRFVNEADMLRAEFHGTIVRVERVASDDVRATGESAHVSEQEFLKIRPDWLMPAKFGQLPLLYQQADSLARLSGLRPA